LKFESEENSGMKKSKGAPKEKGAPQSSINSGGEVKGFFPVLKLGNLNGINK